MEWLHVSDRGQGRYRHSHVRRSQLHRQALNRLMFELIEVMLILPDATIMAMQPYQPCPDHVFLYRPCPQAFIDEKAHSVARVWGVGDKRQQWDRVMDIGSELSCLLHAFFTHTANLQVAFTNSTYCLFLYCPRRCWLYFQITLPL